MHRTLTLAALEKGKHVLTEARMASTAQDARDMLDASQKHPELICQLTPTSTTYKIDNLLKKLITDGHLGEVLSVEVQALQNRFADFGGDGETSLSSMSGGASAFSLSSLRRAQSRERSLTGVHETSRGLHLSEVPARTFP